MPGALPTMKLGDLLGEAGQGGVLLFAVRLEDLAASSRSKRSDMPSSDVVSGPRILNSYPLNSLRLASRAVAAGPRILNSYPIDVFAPHLVDVAAGPRILNSYPLPEHLRAPVELRLDLEF